MASARARVRKCVRVHMGTRTHVTTGEMEETALPRGEVLIVGGDLAYPRPTRHVHQSVHAHMCISVDSCVHACMGPDMLACL